MENMRKKILIAYDKNYIVTAEVEVRDWNGYPEFSTSFNVGRLANITDECTEERVYDYYLDYFDCLGNEGKLNLLQDGEVTKEQAIQNMIDEACYYNGDGCYYGGMIDCSCTNYEFEFNHETYNFESESCGQVDIRKDYNFKLSNNVKKLLEFWDNHHLSKITEKDYKELLKILEGIENEGLPSDYDIQEFLENYYREVLKNENNN